MSELNGKTFIFYPELGGMNASITAVFILILIGASMVFLPEVSIMFDKKIQLNSMVLYTAGGTCLLLSAIIYSVAKVASSSAKYFLTETKLVVESGFATKTISNLDLKKVTDLELKQTAIQNFFGGCTIIIYSNDITDPVMKIKGLYVTHGKNVFKLLGYFTGLQSPEVNKKIEERVELQDTNLQDA
jgi:uncharacterized membrane protein YdbT with pleckstrin-like domain